MRILLISSSYNGLCQRAHVELEALGHDISITLALSPDDIRKGVTLFQPDLIICPFLKEKIPEDVWSKHLCLIIHPGIKGDRGPSSLDWAIMNGEAEWGVTVLQAVEEMDAGDIWATETFQMRRGPARREFTGARSPRPPSRPCCWPSGASNPAPTGPNRSIIRNRMYAANCAP
jgi:putative two-component system hydrogenase maturation factor HypX/HoxX